jgi:hypothetical protein
MTARRLGARVTACVGSLLLAAGAAMASAEVVEGDAVSSRGAVPTSYQWRVENCEGRIRSEWRTAGGQIIAWDEVEFRGAQFLRYRLVRPNLGQDMTLRGSGDVTLAGPMLIEFARRNLPTLRSGRELRVSYLVAERGSSVELRLRATRAAGPRTEVVVDAASGLLRPFVPRASLQFDSAARFVGMEGQILPQLGSRSRPEPVAAQVRVLSHGLTSPCHI